MKKILVIATGGTIASKYTPDGLSPAISAEELLSYVPQALEFCEIDTESPFQLDSTNVGPRQWLILAKLIEARYDHYDGFVICHGTDTMAYTAAALSYLIQNNRRPIVVTGAQKPIDLEVTDARTNLLDSLRFACDDRAYGVTIVFGGMVIAGTRAKKERSKSYNAFSSINYPPIALLQDDRIAFYIDDKFRATSPLKVYHELDTRVYLHKLIPGDDGRILDLMRPYMDAVIIESFGVGGLPNYADSNAEPQTEANDTSLTEANAASLTEANDTSLTEANGASLTEANTASLTEAKGASLTEAKGTSQMNSSCDLQADSCTASRTDHEGNMQMDPVADRYYDEIRRYVEEDKQVIMATQVVHEGSDMSIYQVGKNMKAAFDLPESYDMTLEACVTKTMWALAQAKDSKEFRALFYKPINHDMLFSPNEI